MSKVTFKGLPAVLRNLNQGIDDIRQGTRKGLTKAGVLIRREGQKITPVDTGNLVNSWYGPNIHSALSGMITAEIGLTAAYAPAVHEMVDATFRKPGAQAKFLETPLKEISGQILQIIRDNARVKQ